MTPYKHILLADDDRDDIDLFQLAAEESSTNIQISTAGNGQLLLELLEGQPLPDMIVLDLNMPRMSGFECLKRIRKNRKYNNVPIMILSTSSLQEDLEYCMANGANYYAVKPKYFKDIRKMVDDLFNGVLLNQIHNEHQIG